MKKNSFLLVFGLIVILNGWWFVRNKQPPPPEAGVVDVWATRGDSPEQLQALFDRFGQSNDISVKVTTRVREDELLKAMTGPQPPDMVIMSSNQLVQAYAEQSLIEPLDLPERRNTTIVQGPVVILPVGAADQEMASRLLAWMMSPEMLLDEVQAEFTP